MKKVMTSQKIRLVLPRSKIPVGSSCASTIAMGTPFPVLLEHEGDEQGEHDAVERERLHEAYPQEHERSGLVEGLRLTVDGGYGLPDQIPHSRSRTDNRRARGDADPDHGDVTARLQQRQRGYYKCQYIHSCSFRLSADSLDLLLSLTSGPGTSPVRCKPA